MRCIAFNKPFRVLCQFSASGDKATLADFIDAPGLYPAGRLDHDSEGLLLLTDNGSLQQRISHPRFSTGKTYLAQVEGDVPAAAVAALLHGVTLKDGPARALAARRVTAPDLWPRNPPIRYRRDIPTSWIELQLGEGRNRQVRRMTAAIGHPTLRLVRTAIGSIGLQNLAPGEWRALEPAEWRPLAARARSR